MKRLELLKETIPRVSRVTVLANPTNPEHVKRLQQLEGAARILRVNLHVLEARAHKEIDDAFAAMAGGRAEALLVLTDPLFNAHRELLGNLIAKHRLPAVCFFREFAEAGGLLSYAPSFVDLYRRLATYVDRILKGAKPSDLPIERPTKFEFVVNLKTARALGLMIPPTILSRADLVIE